MLYFILSAILGMTLALLLRMVQPLFQNLRRLILHTARRPAGKGSDDHARQYIHSYSLWIIISVLLIVLAFVGLDKFADIFRELKSSESYVFVFHEQGLVLAIICAGIVFGALAANWLLPVIFHDRLRTESGRIAHRRAGIALAVFATLALLAPNLERLFERLSSISTPFGLSLTLVERGDDQRNAAIRVQAGASPQDSGDKSFGERSVGLRISLASGMTGWIDRDRNYIRFVFDNMARRGGDPSSLGEQRKKIDDILIASRNVFGGLLAPIADCAQTLYEKNKDRYSIDRLYRPFFARMRAIAVAHAGTAQSAKLDETFRKAVTDFGRSYVAQFAAPGGSAEGRIDEELQRECSKFAKLTAELLALEAKLAQGGKVEAATKKTLDDVARLSGDFATMARSGSPYLEIYFAYFDLILGDVDQTLYNLAKWVERNQQNADVYQSMGTIRVVIEIRDIVASLRNYRLAVSVSELQHEFISKLFFEGWGMTPVKAWLQKCEAAVGDERFVTEARVLHIYFDNVNSYVVYNALGGRIDPELLRLAEQNTKISDACLRKYLGSFADHIRAAYLDTYGLALYRSVVQAPDYATTRRALSRTRLATARETILEALRITDKSLRKQTPRRAATLTSLSDHLFAADALAAKRQLFRAHLELIESALRQLE